MRQLLKLLEVLDIDWVIRGKGMIEKNEESKKQKYKILNSTNDNVNNSNKYTYYRSNI